MQKLLKFIFLITDQLKNYYIVFINIINIIKKGSGGNYLMLLDDFALEPSEKFNSIFLKTEFADLNLNLLNLKTLKKSFFVPANHT